MNAEARRFGPVIVASLLIAAAQVGRGAGAPAAPSDANIAPCQACHGAHGEGMAAAHVPRIAGQSADYLKKQLDDYANGTRDDPVMSNFAKALSDQQRSTLATRYAAMSAPFIAQTAVPDAAQSARGHQLAFQGDEIVHIQACNNCHGPHGIGLPQSAPYLAGQSAEYLASAIKAWQRGTRKNDAGQLMRAVVERLNDSDTAAVADYYAGLRYTAH